MKDRIHLQIVTAAGVVYDNMVESVNIPLTDGTIGVLPDHAPLMGAVADGVVTCTFSGGEEAITVGVGVVSIVSNEVTVLVRAAELGGDRDGARAEAAERRARELLARRNADTDVQRAEAALHRAVARQHAADLARRRR